MARRRKLEFCLPDEQGWADIVRECRLNDAQQSALRSTIDEVAERCKNFGSGPADRELKSALSTLDKAFDRLQLCLNRRDITQALDTIETFGAMGRLISATAATELAAGPEPGVPVVEIERLVDRKRFRQEPIHPSDLDGLCLVDRQRWLDQATAQVMQLVITLMRQPISNWLYLAGQDKGGNRPKSDRELLILLLARDAQEIIGTEPSSEPASSFFKLCTAVLGACGFDDQGYEEAVKRCLENYHEWLVWHSLPALQGQSGEAA